MMKFPFFGDPEWPAYPPAPMSTGRTSIRLEGRTIGVGRLKDFSGEVSTERVEP
jgi:hypothetical protein